MTVTPLEWGITLVVLVGLIVFDLVVGIRRPHAVSSREALVWTAFYVTLAVLFGVLLWVRVNGDIAGQFYAGWLTEYSLSIDNLFVFVIIMSRFRVPQVNQQFVLFVGILLALALRAVFIALGAAAIKQFSWVFYAFGAFLVYTAVKLATGSEGETEEFHENSVIRRVRKVVPTTQYYDGNKFRTVVDGRRIFTPLLIVIVAIGTTDLLFALDSIPAIFGLTKEPYLVFAANAFALMGLRQLYFLLGGLLDRLVYLSYGLAVILGFIGVKLILEALHDNTLPFINGGQPLEQVPMISTAASLTVVFVVLAVTTVASLRRSRADGTAA